MGISIRTNGTPVYYRKKECSTRTRIVQTNIQAECK